MNLNEITANTRKTGGIQNPSYNFNLTPPPH